MLKNNDPTLIRSYLYPLQILIYSTDPKIRMKNEQEAVITRFTRLHLNQKNQVWKRWLIIGSLTSRDSFRSNGGPRGWGKLFKIFDTLCAHRWFPRLPLFSLSLSFFFPFQGNEQYVACVYVLIRMRVNVRVPVILHPFDVIRRPTWPEKYQPRNLDAPLQQV